VGSSVIHLGDHNVPNALMFIDKYTQVSRILNPIVICIQQIEELVRDDGLKRYIDHTFGGVDKLRKDILRDFFMHGIVSLLACYVSCASCVSCVCRC
jgi:hypothetical protein